MSIWTAVLPDNLYINSMDLMSEIDDSHSTRCCAWWALWRSMSCCQLTNWQDLAKTGTKRRDDKATAGGALHRATSGSFAMLYGSAAEAEYIQATWDGTQGSPGLHGNWDLRSVVVLNAVFGSKRPLCRQCTVHPELLAPHVFACAVVITAWLTRSERFRAGLASIKDCPEQYGSVWYR
jgi:hypothetical protein